MAYYLNLNTNNTQKRELITDLTPLTCDLNQQDCHFAFGDKKVFVALNPKPLASLQDLELRLENLGDYTNLKAVAYGLNMYMGDINPVFVKTSSDSYKAKVVLSSCAIDVMRYRVEFFDGNQKLDFYFDFDVRR
ncbi:hypothetical protein [Campylobacter sp. US33a]|uniref:hypothetical protein n=1 Tax=Campylobacter sp. US33a TaxID=2498120 RepID=UPI001FB93ACA|nr:hypothetical protein [Campylobacter sp. US33a]